MYAATGNEVTLTNNTTKMLLLSWYDVQLFFRVTRVLCDSPSLF